jgi:hypothetical protein
VNSSEFRGASRAEIRDVIAEEQDAWADALDDGGWLEPDAEALSLLAMSAGLGNSVLAGQSSLEQARAVIDYHLDRLFPASRPALRPVAPDGGVRGEPARTILARSAAGTRWPPWRSRPSWFFSCLATWPPGVPVRSRVPMGRAACFPGR